MPRRAAATEWGQNVVRLMDAKGLNRQELAEKAGLTPAQVTRLIGHTRDSRISLFRAVADALEVPLWQLFVPADLAADLAKGIELKAQLTPIGNLSNAPTEAQVVASAPQSAEFSDENLRHKVLATIRELASALEPQERGEEGRLIARRALAESQTVDHGSVSTGPPHRPRRRHRDSA